jgi:carbon monoxide dehydrogenase subunit G
MIHFEGERTFPHPVDHVFAKLGDASFLVDCLNDVEEISQKGADRAVWKLTPRLSFVRTKLDITMDIVERTASSSIKVKMFSRGIGATSTVESVLSLKPVDAGTAVHWSADITELTGLMKLVPKGLISSSASKVIEDTWSEIAKKLQA